MLIAVVNESTDPAVTPQAVGEYCAAQAHQFRYNFCPAWGLTAPAVIPAASLAVVPPGAAIIILRDTSDQPGALAYHDETAKDVKVCFVFVKTVAAAGVSWQSAASHEALEMLADQSCNRYAVDAYNNVVALEVCDPVESDAYEITMTNGHQVEVSDFVYPAWFDPSAPDGTRTRQLAGHGKPNLSPFELAAGGYMIQNGKTVFADGAAEARRALKGGGGHSSHRPLVAW